MHCEEARERLLEAAEGGLAEADSAAIREHIGDCPACRAEYERLQRASEALHDAVSSLAPPTTYLSPSRFERLSKAFAQRRRPIRLITWRRFAVAAAIAAIIASAPFIVGDLVRMFGPAVEPSLASGGRPGDDVAVVFTSVEPQEDPRPTGVVPVRAREPDAVDRPAPRGTLVRTDSPGVRVPVQHALYDSEESSRWW
ncbi:MAG: zf-HC2 domain-containing protein [Candidatus Brocadiaceae bacterium]|jgi:hypothetical protein